DGAVIVCFGPRQTTVLMRARGHAPAPSVRARNALDSELDDLGVIVDLVGLGIAIRFLVPTALSERATRGVQALAALVDGEGDSLPGFRVPKVEACDVPRHALDRFAQVLHRDGIEGARIETAESCNAGDHSGIRLAPQIATVRLARRR